MKVLHTFFDQILWMSVMASIVIATVLLIRILLKRFPRKYSYLLWLIVGIRLVCPVAVPSSLSLFNLQFLPGQDREAESRKEADLSEGLKYNQYKIFPDGTMETIVQETNTGNNDAVSAMGQFDTMAGLSQGGMGEESQTGSVLEGQSASVIPNARKAVVFIWLTGITLLFLWNIYLTVRVRHKLCKAVLYKENIYECEGIASPFVFGLLRPRIYIPFRLGEEEREYILQHEQYHIKKRDYIIKAAAFLILTIYWFHPLVWVSYFCMVRDMEISCDEYVLTSMGQDIRKKYSQSLLAFATNRRHLSIGLLGFGETDTRRRVRHILNFHKKGRWMGILAGIIVLAVAAVCLTNRKAGGSGNEGEQHNMAQKYSDLGVTAEDVASAEKVEPVENQIRIGFWRPEDAEAEPVYYGGGEKLERLQELAERLDPEHSCTKAELKKWQKEKQTGYFLSYKGNDWDVYTGGYVALMYGRDEKEDPEKNAIIYLPELCREAGQLCKTELNYQRIEPSEIKDVVSAKLSYKKKDGIYVRQTIKDKSKLGTLEDILSKAEDMGGASACPFGTAVLTLKLESGREIPVTWADDSCRVIRINGIYFEYMDQHLSFSPDGIRALFDKIPWKGLLKSVSK